MARGCAAPYVSTYKRGTSLSHCAESLQSRHSSLRDHPLTCGDQFALLECAAKNAKMFGMPVEITLPWSPPGISRYS